MEEERKVCVKCGEEQDIDEYYILKNGKINNQCKTCLKEYSNFYHQKKREEEENERVPMQPNRYMNDAQKQDTFKFMQVLGWTFNEEEQIWYKLPLKDKDGKFHFPNQKVKILNDRKEYMKQYMKQYMKKYYAKNSRKKVKEKVVKEKLDEETRKKRKNESKKKWNELNTDILKKYSEKSKKKRKEVIKEYQKEYYQKKKTQNK
jgi:hypothetical protein